MSLAQFSLKLKKLCGLIGMTQVELARRIGMQPSHLNLFFQGRGDIHSQRLLELLLELGINIERMIDGAVEEITRPQDSEIEILVSQIRRMSRAERESLSLIVSRLTFEHGDKRRSS